MLYANIALYKYVLIKIVKLLKKNHWLNVIYQKLKTQKYT